MERTHRPICRVSSRWRAFRSSSPIALNTDCEPVYARHHAKYLRTYHELVSNFNTLLECALPPSCLGEGSIFELDIELGFVWVCPGYIRFLVVGNDGRLCLYVGHEYEVADSCDLGRFLYAVISLSYLACQTPGHHECTSLRCCF